MADFSDVARFTQEHAGCGGIVPAVTMQRSSGYLLTLTCRCGAIHDRWVTPEEAKLAPFATPPAPTQSPGPPAAGPAAPPPAQPAPPSPAPPAARPSAPPSAPPATPRPPAPPQRVTPSPGSAPTRPTPPAARPTSPAASTQRPGATPSPELEAAMREALEAEAAAPSAPTTREGPRVTPSPEIEAAMRAALEAESAAPPPSAPPKPRPQERTRGSDEGSKLTPSPELEAVMRQLKAEAAQTAGTASGKSARSGRAAPSKLDVGNTVKEALRQQNLMKQGGDKTDAGVRRPTNAAAWIIVALVSVAAGIGGMWYLSTIDEPPEQRSGRPTTPGTGAARPAVPSVSIDQAAQALRALHSSIGPSLSLPAYQARVAATQNALGPFLEGSAPADAKTIVRETLEVYVLAGAAWQARSADSREAWESIGRSPALELCSSVKQAADAAGSGQERGRAVGSAITTLWDCAERRIAQLDRLRTAR